MDDPRERLARLEVQLEHLREMVDEMRIEGAATRVAVSEMRDLLAQARGARWLLGLLLGVAGFASAYLPSIAKWTGILPR